MVGITDIANDAVNFRDREGGNPEGNIPKKKILHGPTEQQLCKQTIYNIYNVYIIIIIIYIYIYIFNNHLYYLFIFNYE